MAVELLKIDPLTVISGQLEFVSGMVCQVQLERSDLNPCPFGQGPTVWQPALQEQRNDPFFLKSRSTWLRRYNFYRKWISTLFRKIQRPSLTRPCFSLTESNSIELNAILQEILSKRLSLFRRYEMIWQGFKITERFNIRLSWRKHKVQG